MLIMVELTRFAHLITFFTFINDPKKLNSNRQIKFICLVFTLTVFLQEFKYTLYCSSRTHSTYMHGCTY